MKTAVSLGLFAGAAAIGLFGRFIMLALAAVILAVMTYFAARNPARGEGK